MGKSTGQIIGTVVGGVIGAFVGYPMLGASLGGMIGGAIDPPKGPDIKGPRLNDLSVQSSSYGQVIPRVYGTVALAGNVFWIENNALAEHEKTEEQGGKGGGGGATTTSYWYSSTFALGLCEGPIEGIRRIWVSGKLIYDAGSSDVNTIIASNLAMMSVNAMMSGIGSAKNNDASPAADASPKWTLYYGDNTQTANPRMEATLGVGNVPGYRGLAYIVFEDFDLTNYGNSLMGAQFKVEVVKELSYSSSTETQCDFITPTTGDVHLSHTLRILSDRVRETQINALIWNYDLYSVSSQDFVIGSTAPLQPSESDIPTWHDSAFQSKLPLSVVQTDVDIVAFILYRNTPSRLLAYDAAGVLVMDTGEVPAATLPYEGYFAAVRDGEMYLCTYTNTRPIYKLPVRVEPSTYFGPSLASPVIYNSSQIGVSENYVFTLDYIATSPTSCTVRRIKRSDLTLDATWTQAVSGSYAMLYVESDEVVYTMSNQSGDDVLYRWVSGVASDTGVRYSGTSGAENRIAFASPLLAYVYDSTTPTALTICYRSVVPETVTLASIVEAECLKSGMLTASDIDVSALTQEVRGYRVTQVAAIRAGLEPLQGAWPFDVIQNGYKIKFIPRGGSSVGTVTKEELGAAAPGDNNVISITESREMDAQIARKAVITFLDVNREYDVSEQSAERLNTDAVNIRSIEMPIVLTADEGAQIVERLLYLWWLERRDLSFTLPPTWLHLQPADVVTIQSANATFEARLTSCQYLPDGRIEVEAKYNDAPVYVSTAVGAEPPYTGQTLTLSGPSNLILIDGPTMNDAMDRPCLLAGMGGYTSGWKSGALFRSTDNGQTWTNLQGFTSAMVAGQAIDAPGAGRTDILDASTRITVQIYPSSADMVSVSFTTLLSGVNWYAWGADGRWEIIGIQDVTDNGYGTFTAYNLLRGRFGTEWAMTTHAILDEVVLLDTAALRIIGLNAYDINTNVLYRGVTTGSTLDSASDESQTYAAVNLKPLSPVYLNGHREPSSNNWTLTWTRRTRIGGEWCDGIDASLGEASEAYEVEIWNSTYTTLKRTITVLGAATCGYTSEQQVADFGSNQDTLYVKIYQISATIGRGYPLTASIFRVSPDDPYGYAVVLGMHLSVNLSCVRGRVATAYGNAAVSGGFLNLDGTGDYLLLDGSGTLAPGTGPFTVEMRYKPTSVSSDVSLYDSRPTAVNGWYISIFATPSGGIMFFANNAARITTATGLLSVGVEAHIALCRDASGNWRVFVDGTQAGSTYTDSNNYLNASARPAIGANGASLAVHQVNGKIRDLRVTAAARYTTTFTPPSAPYADP